MGLFSSVASSVLRFDTEPMKEFMRKSNFLSACCELADKYGYEILCLRNDKDPIKIGKIDYYDDFLFVSLETCETLDYRLITFGSTNYLTPMDRISRETNVPAEVINKNYYSKQIDYRLLTSFGITPESAFDIFRRIERSRNNLADLQKNNSEYSKEISEFLLTKGIPELNRVPRSSDYRDFR